MALISRIDLLRHGETQKNHHFCGSTNVPLTEYGWKQMWTTTRQNMHDWEHIITSPLKRCAYFAQELGQHYSIPITQDERLKEVHFGEWEGRAAAELIKTDALALARFWNEPIDHAPPNAECLYAFEARVLRAWNDITRQFAGKKILLVTHGGVIRILLCHILQHPIERLLEFKVAHAAMHQIHVEHGQDQCQTKFLINKPI